MTLFGIHACVQHIASGGGCDARVCGSSILTYVMIMLNLCLLLNNNNSMIVRYSADFL